MAQHDMTPIRKRARQACQACNARRVKCDVTEQIPCRNCVAANVRCEIRESRRGKHPRHPRGSISQHSDIAAPTEVSEPPHQTDVPSDVFPIGPGTLTHQNSDEVEASHVLASLSKDGQITGVNSREDSRQPVEDDAVAFLGESTSIRYVTEPTPSARGPIKERTHRLRHSIPNAAKADSLIPQWEADRRRARVECLKAEGAFSLPMTSIVEQLLRAYFRWFHPTFAVVNETEIWDEYHNGSLSPLLLQAMLFVASIHCEESLLQEAGLGTRLRAKYLLYNRAKDIYDADYETKKFTVLQSLFLMSFWRAGALLEKDVRHWLGVAISLAQSKALHRAIGNAKSPMAKLRRRLWWSIYVRERQCAAALGLPNRIRDEDCDVEALKRSDFDGAFDSAKYQNEDQNYISYAIGIAALSKMLGEIIHSGYLPNKTLTKADRAYFKDKLLHWRQSLPSSMSLDNDFSDIPSFHANMLHLAYNNLLILLFRGAYIASDDDADGQSALQAASRNSRIIEDMLPRGDLRHGQIHMITNLFNTLCIHTVSLRRLNGTARTIAEHRAKLCLLGLQELQKTWDVTNWVLQLFFQYLDRSTAAQLQMRDSETGTAIMGGPSTVPTSGQVRGDRFSDEQPRTATCSEAHMSAPRSSNQMSALPTGMVADSPWSWSTEEANSFLFSQIENDFTFGEGAGAGRLSDWGTDTGAFAGWAGFDDLSPTVTQY